jgi:hypothetical protein
MHLIRHQRRRARSGLRESAVPDPLWDSTNLRLKVSREIGWVLEWSFFIKFWSVLGFDRAGGQAGDELFLQKQVDDYHGRNGECERGKQLRELGLVLVHEKRLQTQRQCLQVRVVNEDQGQKEFVPGLDKSENGNGESTGVKAAKRP